MGTLRFRIGIRRRQLRFVDWHWFLQGTICELFRKARAKRSRVLASAGLLILNTSLVPVHESIRFSGTL